MRIAVTGANGFVGRSLVKELTIRGYKVRALVRYPDASLASYPIETVATGPIESISDWRPYLTGTDCVVHLAARAHLKDKDMLDAEKFRAVNINATLALARSAAKRKVKHFIYLSSIGVHGDETTAHGRFSPSSPFNPQTHYARSKAEAEDGLRDMAGAMTITSLRPPLIYGPGARGNFRALCHLVQRAPALPFHSLRNRRSLLAVENLSSAICTILEKPQEGYAAYTICDEKSYSLPDLISIIAKGLNKHCMLVPLPVFILRQAAALIGRSDEITKLTQSLLVDSKDFCSRFNWSSAVESDIALVQAAASYLNDSRL